MNDELKRKENLPLMFLMDNQYQKIKSELLQNNIDNYVTAFIGNARNTVELIPLYKNA